MRILFVTYRFFPQIFGGEQKAAFEMAKYLVFHGHEVEVWTFNAFIGNRRIPWREKYLLRNRIHVVYFDSVLDLSSNITNALSLFKIASIYHYAIKKLNTFDIIHIHGYRNPLGQLIAHIAIKEGLPYIVTLHGSFPRRSKKFLKIIQDAFLGYRMLHRATRIFAISSLEKYILIKSGFRSSKIKIIPIGIDVVEYQKKISVIKKGFLKEKINANPDTKIILYLGRLHPLKGVKFIVSGFKELLKRKDDYPNLLLVLAGPGKDYFKKITKNLEPKIREKIIYIGTLTETEKLQALMDADLVIYPEKFNVYGIVPLEAAFCKTPVIVSRSNYVYRIVKKGKFGLGITYGDIDDLIDKITKILSNDKLRKKLGENGYQYVLKYLNWERIIKKMEMEYMDIVSSRI